MYGDAIVGRQAPSVWNGSWPHASVCRSKGMTTLQLPRHLQAMRVKSCASMAPPPLVEYTYYAILFYNMTAAALGILIPKLAGGMLLMLAAFCIMRLGSQATAVYAPIKLPLACVTSYLVVQITFHGASVTEGIDFITWLLMLI